MDQTSPLVRRRAMGTSYRIYFRGRKDDILGRQDLEAEDHRAALQLAGVLCDACSDVVGGVEVWQGTRRVDLAHPAPLSPEALGAQTQERILDLEERLRDSRWAVSRSRRLLEQLRDRTERSPPPPPSPPGPSKRPP